MKIESVQLVLPSRVVSNAQVLEMIEHHSSDTYIGDDLSEALKKISMYLKYSGSNTRHWLDTGDRPIELMCSAVEAALEDADVSREDIDVLVYTGIGRGFLEPGGAYHTANALGMHHVECYDVIDACMSWTRAMQQLQALFKTGVYKRALVVNAEFNMYEGSAIYPAVFGLNSIESVEWTFPAFTLGEGTTATVVRADEPDEDNTWSFNFASRPDLSELCNIPIENYEGYCMPSEKVGKNGVGRFTSFGSGLVEHGKDAAIQVMAEMDVNVDEVKGIFTHASSKRDWEIFAQELGLKSLLKPIYQDTGNLVSASVPGALATAINRESVKKGDKVMGWVGSAGMSFCAYSFFA